MTRMQSFGSTSEMNQRDTVLFFLAIAGIAWYIALWCIGLLGCYAARRRYRLHPQSSVTAGIVPGVSILRPLKGLDSNLYENLESTFTQEYPNFEIIFSVADKNDQALHIARDLMLKYPSINTRVIIGEEIVGVNPKVNNLVGPYREAANDILWVLDSNVMVHPGMLSRSVGVLVGSSLPIFSRSRKRVSLVHHVPFAVTAGSGIGSKLEEAFLNTNHAKMYLAINTLAIESCVVGKSNLYRRSDVERLNGTLKPNLSKDDGARHPVGSGLHIFGRFLAEDNMIASALWHELGTCHDLSCDVACNVVGSMSLSDYVWRRVRWIRVRKHMVLVATLLEPFTEAFVLCVIACTSLKYLFDVPTTLTLILHFSLLLYVDLDVYASLAGHGLPALAQWEFLLAWTTREAIALPIFLLAILGDEVVWRGSRYRLLRNGDVEYVAAH